MPPEVAGSFAAAASRFNSEGAPEVVKTTSEIPPVETPPVEFGEGSVPPAQSTEPFVQFAPVEPVVPSTFVVGDRAEIEQATEAMFTTTAIPETMLAAPSMSSAPAVEAMQEAAVSKLHPRTILEMEAGRAAVKRREDDAKAVREKVNTQAADRLETGAPPRVDDLS